MFKIVSTPDKRVALEAAVSPIVSVTNAEDTHNDTASPVNHNNKRHLESVQTGNKSEIYF